MLVSLVTVLIFLALTPGAFFILGIRTHPALAPSDVFDSQTQEITTLLSISFLTFAVSVFFWLHICPSTVDGAIELFNGIRSGSQKLNSAGIQGLFWPVIFFMGGAYTVSFLVGLVFPRLQFGSKKIRRNMKGTSNVGLRKFIYQISDREVLFAWILTKSTHDEKHLMYLGLVRHVKIQRDLITYVTLQYPSKTYIAFEDFLKTTHPRITNTELPKPMMSKRPNTGELFYISQENIANIYFERLVPFRPKSKLMLIPAQHLARIGVSLN